MKVSVDRDFRFSMVDSLVANRIDVALLWPPWPETFSFTLYESLAAGCFVLTNGHSGNISDYLIQNPRHGLVMSDERALFKLFNGKDLELAVSNYQKNGKPRAELLSNQEIE